MYRGAERMVEKKLAEEPEPALIKQNSTRPTIRRSFTFLNSREIPVDPSHTDATWFNARAVK